MLATIAGTPFTNGYSGDGGPATQATFNNPVSVAVGSTGNLYVMDQTNGVVREVSAATGVISTVAFSNSLYGNCPTPGGSALSTPLNPNPRFVAVDSSGDLFVADTSGGGVFKVSASTGIVTGVAGQDSCNAPLAASYSGEGGLATQANGMVPTGIAVAPNGDLYIADSVGCAVRKVSAATGIITTVAGIPGNLGTATGDGGLATNAVLGGAQSSGVAAGLAVDASGDIFIGTSNNAVVREVSAATGIITTIAGTIQNPGFSGDGGPASQALLSGAAQGLAVDGSCHLFIADVQNEVIRGVTLPGCSLRAGYWSVASDGDLMNDESVALLEHETALTALASLMERARVGYGGALFVVGDAELGKTSLVGRCPVSKWWNVLHRTTTPT